MSELDLNGRDIAGDETDRATMGQRIACAVVIAIVCIPWWVGAVAIARRILP